jgi:hypothetical protein
MPFLKNKVIADINTLDTNVRSNSGDNGPQGLAPKTHRENNCEAEHCYFVKDYFGPRRRQRGPDKCF